jgi:hypothetical protein
MKNLKSITLAIVATVALPLSATQYVFVPGDNSLGTKICIAAAENNLPKYKRQVRLTSVKKVPDYRIIANTLTCNDQNLARFAMQYQANKTAAFINRYSEHEVIIRREVSDASNVLESVVEDDDKIVYVTVN